MSHIIKHAIKDLRRLLIQICLPITEYIDAECIHIKISVIISLGVDEGGGSSESKECII